MKTRARQRHLPMLPRVAGGVASAAAGHRRKCRRAFTLLEVMLALAVFSMVIASIYATWALVMRAARVGKDTTTQAQRQRVVLRTIEDALMGVESFQASQNYYWFRLENGGSPILSFSSCQGDMW